MADEHTKAMTACFVDAGTGYRHDLKAIGSWCRAHNIPFGVDATQACGAMKLDVQDMQVDFLATSVYKWLQGLQGLGFAYISPKLMPRLKQYEMGWANVSDRINGKPFDLIMSDTPAALRTAACLPPPCTACPRYCIPTSGWAEMIFSPHPGTGGLS